MWCVGVVCVCVCVCGVVCVCVCVCVCVSNRKKSGQLFNNVCFECYLACASDTESKRRVELIRRIRVLF